MVLVEKMESAVDMVSVIPSLRNVNVVPICGSVRTAPAVLVTRVVVVMGPALRMGRVTVMKVSRERNVNYESVRITAAVTVSAIRRLVSASALIVGVRKIATIKYASRRTDYLVMATESADRVHASA